MVSYPPCSSVSDDDRVWQSDNGKARKSRILIITAFRVNMRIFVVSSLLSSSLSSVLNTQNVENDFLL